MGKLHEMCIFIKCKAQICLYTRPRDYADLQMPIIKFVDDRVGKETEQCARKKFGVEKEW